MNGQGADGKQGRGGEFAKQAVKWQTPVLDSFCSKSGSSKDEMGLNQQSRFWATPRTMTGGAETAERKQELGRTESGGGDLQAQVQMWGTPTSRDWKDGTSADTAPTNGLLGRQVIQNWGTPRVTTNGGNPSPQCTGNGSRLEDQAGIFPSSLPAQSIHDGQQSFSNLLGSPRPSAKKRLNPLFVTWMMGWPLFWTAPVPISSARVEMASWLSIQRMLLRFLLDALD